VAQSDSSYYDIDRIFLRGTAARDIAEPLRSFDATTAAADARVALATANVTVAGVRAAGLVTGFVVADDLDDGVCGDHLQPFAAGQVVPAATGLSDVVLALNEWPFLFVEVFGAVGGLVTRADLQDPPVRMWLFGMITLIEMRFAQLIARHYDGDAWLDMVSKGRLAKAQALQEERQRRGQFASLLDCLQFSDKAQIVLRDPDLREIAGFVSRRRGEQTMRHLEALRNNLAHAQDIVTFDWEVIVAMAENLENVLGRLQQMETTSAAI
jgi:hypothetical protein